MAKLPVQIKVSSMVDVLSSIDDIVKVFSEEGLLVIKGHRFSLDDQVLLASRLGDIFDWNVYTGVEQTVLNSAIYPGGHSENPDASYDHTRDEYKLDWHIEQVFYKDPVLAGIWNMTKFTAEPGAGSTRFVDSIKLYSDLDKNDQDFLAKSVVSWEKQMPLSKGPFYTNVVSPHPLNGDPTLRLEVDQGCDKMPELHAWGGDKATEGQILRFASIAKSIKSTLMQDEEIRYVQTWEEGDLLLVDLFRMYHAVMGGFGYDQRTFTGIGIRPRKYAHDLYTSEELM